ncbi:UNVERIFIED_CONTAM: hypothetical protein NCL1_20968 [Trichonephila clavipes]
MELMKHLIIKLYGGFDMNLCFYIRNHFTIECFVFGIYELSIFFKNLSSNLILYLSILIFAFILFFVKYLIFLNYSSNLVVFLDSFKLSPRCIEKELQDHANVNYNISCALNFISIQFEVKDLIYFYISVLQEAMDKFHGCDQRQICLLNLIGSYYYSSNLLSFYVTPILFLYTGCIPEKINYLIKIVSMRENRMISGSYKLEKIPLIKLIRMLESYNLFHYKRCASFIIQFYVKLFSVCLKGKRKNYYFKNDDNH